MVMVSFFMYEIWSAASVERTLCCMQDGEPMKVPSGVNPSFTEVNATTELLLKVNLLKCWKDNDQCIAPGAAITDFNIWDKSFSAADLQAWTACRYLHNSF